MSENEMTTADLLKMATELVDGIGRMWPDERLGVVGREKVCTVVTGYQELVRRMAELIGEISTYLNDINAHGLIVHSIDKALTEARAAIPKHN